MSFNVKSSTYYFHMKTKKQADFQICISLTLNIKCVTICRAKCVGTVISKVLPKICSRQNLVKKSPKFLIPKMKLNIINPLSANFTKWSNILKQCVGNLTTNCLSVFDYFVRLTIKGLMRVSLCKLFNKMFGGFRENDRFLKIFLSTCLEKFRHSFQSFTKCISPLIA